VIERIVIAEVFVGFHSSTDLDEFRTISNEPNSIFADVVREIFIVAIVKLCHVIITLVD
jgi:hypothetical protein